MLYQSISAGFGLGLAFCIIYEPDFLQSAAELELRLWMMWHICWEDAVCVIWG